MTKRARATTNVTLCEPHKIPGTCWKCCEEDMSDHLSANGINPAKYFDGRNGEGTAVKERPTGNGSAGNRTVETATDPQVWTIRKERDRRDTSRVQIPADADIPKMSKRAASLLLDKLTDSRVCPFLPAGKAPARPATPGQLSYVRDLLEDRAYAEPVDIDSLTFASASALIDTLRQAPRLVDACNLADGMYRKNGVMYRVRTDKNGRKMCHEGKITEPEVRDESGTITTPAVIKFYSNPGALRTITDADLMTHSEVTTFGVSYGICVYGHALTKPVSVYAGIGPTCADNMGIDQLAVAMANGYVPLAPGRTRKVSRVAPVAAPVTYESPWALV